VIANDEAASRMKRIVTLMQELEEKLVAQKLLKKRP
jgi:hypothetical protein